MTAAAAPVRSSHGDLRDADVVRQRCADVLEQGLYWFPVRHHSPAVARHVEQAILARRPKVVFLEAPAEEGDVTLYLAALGGSPEATLSQFKAARDVGARISIHVGVGEFGRNALLEKLHAAGGLKDDTTYIHCCTLNDTEWKLMRDTGGTISIAGYVETLMGHGNPPTQKAIDLGIRPSLSVDVETSVPNDFFTQMRTVFSLQKNEVWARRLAGDKNPPKFLTVREVLEFATVEGARANGLERKVGTLTPGKDADIIMLRTDRLNVMPMNSAVGAVVTSMGPQNVDTVLIAGKVMKRNGQLVGVDHARLVRLGNEARDRLYANAKVRNTRL